MRRYKITILQGKEKRGPFSNLPNETEEFVIAAKYPFEARLFDNGMLTLEGVDVDGRYKAVKSYKVEVEDTCAKSL